MAALPVKHTGQVTGVLLGVKFGIFSLAQSLDHKIPCSFAEATTSLSQDEAFSLSLEDRETEKTFSTNYYRSELLALCRQNEDARSGEKEERKRRERKKTYLSK